METIKKIINAIDGRRAGYAEGMPLYTIILNDKARALIASEILKNGGVLKNLQLNKRPRTIHGVPYTIDPYQKQLFRIVER